MEVHYGITSLSAEKADAVTLLNYVRTHWHIGKKMHFVRDVTLSEDACRVRKGSAPPVLAGFRNVAIHLLRKVRVKSHPEAMEVLQMSPERTKQLIGIP